jgi:hypothetical protein
MQAVDYVVVIYKDELGMLALQAASARRFLKREDVNRYLIIVNGDYEACLDYIISNVMPLFGHLRDKVLISRVDEFTQYQTRSYLMQQVAKLMAAKILSHSEFYTCLDAKNFFIRSPACGDLFTVAQPTARIEKLSGAFHIKANRIYSELFGIPAAAPESLVMALMTPFTMKAEFVIGLIDEFEKRSGKEFSEAFCTSETQSEFMLYATYLKYIGENPLTYYKDNALLSRTVWDRGWLETTSLKEVLMFARNHNYLTAAVHRRVLSSLTESEQREFEAFLALLELTDSLPWISDGFWAPKTPS